MPDVSIIIINYNTFQLACACIQSVIEQTKEVSYEIILVDNASVESDPSLFIEKFPDVNLIVSEKNLGFAGGNNLGLQHANAEYILLLNSDTILIENSVLLSLQKFKSLNNIGFLGVKSVYPDGRVQDTCSRLPTIKNIFSDLFFLHQIFPHVKQYYRLDRNFYPDAVWGCFMLFKKDLLARFKEKKLNDTFFMYCEDLLWCWEARKINLKNYYYAETKIIHLNKGSQNNEETSEKMNSLLMENKRKLKIIINGKIGILFYDLLSKILYYRSKLTKRTGAVLKTLFF
ncbi:MAG: glycosyltransferase family 2 protein [Ginsengibacter sp.]